MWTNIVSWQSAFCVIINMIHTLLGKSNYRMQIRLTGCQGIWEDAYFTKRDQICFRLM